MTNYEILKKIRGSWNGINPITKIIPNKKKQKNKKECRKKVKYLD